ncbi:glycerate kinase [Leucobacter sp. W1153]|uniref:glycerate kinase n=1 Tax=Leucobacter sp. W1153 TaxID=3439064 RepID=UPI003F40C038
MSGSARGTLPQRSVPIVVVAPDSLKSSCTAPDAARAIASGVRRALGQGVQIRELPLADGGEGTLDVLVAAWGGEILDVATTDALGRPRTGRVGLSSEKQGARLAVIEAADANGLPAVVDQPLRALDADTAGVGALVCAALSAGATEILMCLGGSATSDGGSGMLRALGARLLDASGNDVAPGARGLAELHEIDLSEIDTRAGKGGWRVACDVDHPLTGVGGAAAVFGPQKGASPEQVELIDRGLARLARLLAEATGGEANELAALPGLGAAGGLALGPVALFGAQLVPGSALVSDAVGLRDALAGAAMVITAEGRLDAQSLQGKVVSRVLAEARDCRDDAPAVAGEEPSSVPVVVLAGSVELSFEECQRAGIAAWSIARGPATLDQLQADTPALLAEAAAHATRVVLGEG